MDFRTSALILTWAAILVLAMAMAGLLRQVHSLARGGRPGRVGPAIGSRAPGLGGDPGNRVLNPAGGTDTVALFLDPHCSSCARSLELAGELAAEHAGRLRLVAVLSHHLDRPAPDFVEVVEHAAETFERYQVPATPYGVLIDAGGRLTAAAPLGSDARLRELVDQALAGRHVR